MIVGMSVEAPQRQATGCQQCRCIFVHTGRLGFGRYLHFPQGIPNRSRNADTALDQVGHARNIGATTTHQHLLRLFPATAGGEIELQRAADLLGHIVDESVEAVGVGFEVPEGRQEARHALLDDLGDAADLGRDDRGAAGHRLERGQSEA